MNNITDVHAHYDETAFDIDRDDVLLNQHQIGVSLIINSGSSVPSSKRSIDLANRFSFMKASVGVFPLEAYSVSDSWLNDIEFMAKDSQCVAIGEIGLDYFLQDADKEKQQDVFIQQLKLAQKLDMPVVIHDRDADTDVLSILDKHPSKGMIHRFFSKSEYGFAFIKRGISLGIGPAITYPNAGELIKVLKAMPLSLLLLETDCPFLPPAQLEGQRATSDMISYVCEKIADVRGDVSAQQVADIAFENAKKLFQLH